MTPSRDYYEVLGVPRDADARTIKNAFRALARRYHPDTSTEPDAEQRFRQVAEAYGVLSDPARRASYDAGVPAGATAEDLWAGIDLADVFGAAAAGFGGLFERLFGPPEAGPPRGQDLRAELVLSLEEVLAGGKHPVTIRRPGPCRRCAGSGSRAGTVPRTCPDCGGTGQRAVASRHGQLLVRQVATCPACGGRGLLIDEPCPGCRGAGRAVQEDTVTIRIPPGIPDRTELRLAGRGAPSMVPGGPPGDAYVTIAVRADPRFTRVGPDLWHDVHLGVPDAVLGATAAVPALDGQVRVAVPPGTQPGAVLRIEGRGLPRYPGHGRGSLNLNVIVDVPRQLSRRQQQLYEQLRAENADIVATGETAPPRQPGAIRRRWRAVTHRRAQAEAPAD